MIEGYSYKVAATEHLYGRPYGTLLSRPNYFYHMVVPLGLIQEKILPDTIGKDGLMVEKIRRVEKNPVGMALW
jgi:hypothetical protein